MLHARTQCGAFPVHIVVLLQCPATTLSVRFLVPFFVWWHLYVRLVCPFDILSVPFLPVLRASVRLSFCMSICLFACLSGCIFSGGRSHTGDAAVIRSIIGLLGHAVHAKPIFMACRIPLDIGGGRCESVCEALFHTE